MNHQYPTQPTTTINTGSGVRAAVRCVRAVQCGESVRVQQCGVRRGPSRNDPTIYPFIQNRHTETVKHRGVCVWFCFPFRPPSRRHRLLPIPSSSPAYLSRQRLLPMPTTIIAYIIALCVWGGCLCVVAVLIKQEIPPALLVNKSYFTIYYIRHQLYGLLSRCWRQPRLEYTASLVAYHHMHRIQRR